MDNPIVKKEISEHEIIENNHIESLLIEDINAEITDYYIGTDAELPVIKKVKLYNPEEYGFDKDDKLHLLIEFENDVNSHFTEDELFNILSGKITYNGVTVDCNPITQGKSGNIEQYLERLNRNIVNNNTLNNQNINNSQSTTTWEEVNDRGNFELKTLKPDWCTEHFLLNSKIVSMEDDKANIIYYDEQKKLKGRFFEGERLKVLIDIYKLRDANNMFNPEAKECIEQYENKIHEIELLKKVIDSTSEKENLNTLHEAVEQEKLPEYLDKLDDVVEQRISKIEKNEVEENISVTDSNNSKEQEIIELTEEDVEQSLFDDDNDLRQPLVDLDLRSKLQGKYLSDFNILDNNFVKSNKFVLPMFKINDNDCIVRCEGKDVSDKYKNNNFNSAV